MQAEEGERKQKEQEKYEYEQNKLSAKFNKIYEKNIGNKVFVNIIVRIFLNKFKFNYHE